MIVRHFLHWSRTAPAHERAAASNALARAYLYSHLTSEEFAAAEGALVMLLDDPSPLVRTAMAKALATSEQAPPAVILGLAADQPDIACRVLQQSPVLLDADLVDAVATGQPEMQAAIAQRASLTAAVSAAIAEVGSAEACLVLLENSRAEIAQCSLDRLVERYGHLAVIREAMIARDDLPAATHQALLAKLSQTLAGMVRNTWLGEDRAQLVAKEACEKATIKLAAVLPDRELPALVRHLRTSGQLTAGLLLRALLSGNIEMFEQALVELSGLSPSRVSALVHDRGSSGFRALFDKAGLPASTYAAFHEAIAAMREDGFVGEAAGVSRLKRRMVERVLTRCADATSFEVEPLLTLLRRFAAEAARDEARALCDQLVASDTLAIESTYVPQRAAA
jgi:uncharacterized protein (DUF2336 family)